MTQKERVVANLQDMVEKAPEAERAKILKAQYSMFTAMGWNAEALEVIHLLTDYGLEGSITVEMRRRKMSANTDAILLQDCTGDWKPIYTRPSRFSTSRNECCFAELFYCECRPPKNEYYLSCRFSKGSLFYTYALPVEKLLAFLAAESHGRYYTKHIKNSCERVTSSYTLGGEGYDENV
ncbi:MAG: hypothetical protein B7C24_16485 [Bacteroidetes bacterium 4572_77]|nr:MAG: hypothetical protein B7C24_16485 [Bacteroidetes bacterium 4572_77]